MEEWGPGFFVEGDHDGFVRVKGFDDDFAEAFAEHLHFADFVDDDDVDGVFVDGAFDGFDADAFEVEEVDAVFADLVLTVHVEFREDGLFFGHPVHDEEADPLFFLDDGLGDHPLDGVATLLDLLDNLDEGLGLADIWHPSDAYLGDIIHSS